MCAFHAHKQQRLLDQKLDVLGTFRNSLLTSAPWDSIIEFATSDKYCGKKLYPRQETLLRLIFLETEQMSQYDLDTIDEWTRGFKKRKDVFGVQPDVWDRVQYLKDRGYRRFPHILSVLGRRASKGMIGGVLGAEQIAYFYSLDDWQAHYGIDAGQDGYLSVVATNQSQAQRFQFADIRRTVENCKYLQPNISTSKESYFSIRTPADVRQIAELKGAGIVVEREIATLRAIALSSNSSSGRGAVGFANFFDEFAFMVQGTGSTKSGEEIYEAWQPSLDQFGRDALTYIPSSPFCLAPDTKVLTEDLRWVPVGSLMVGDKVIGFDEYAPSGKGKGRTWQPAEVTETSVIWAPRYKITMESGKEIVSTSEHMWLAKRSNNQEYGWIKTADLKTGHQIKSLGVEPWDTDESRDGGYLAGFFDAEGCLSTPSLRVSYGQNIGPIRDGVESLLKERDFDTSVSMRSYQGLQKESHLGVSTITGGVPEVLRFIGMIRPERLLVKFREMFYGTNIQAAAKTAERVVSVEQVEDGPVIALGTSTGTLVAESLLNHNTKIGKFFELYKQGSVLMESYTEKHGRTMRLETEQSLNVDAEGEIEELTADPEMLVFQGPSWILYQDWERGPELVGVRFKRPVQPDLTSEVQQRRQKRNPEKFKVERLGQFAEVQDAYLDPDKVDEMFVQPEWRDPLEPQDYGRFDRTYRIHCDPGRCLVGDTYINTDRGMVKIVQVEVGDEVVTRDGTDSVVEWVPNGIKEVYKLTLRGGWEIRATGNHPVWTERGWVPLQELQSDDKVQVKVGANLWPQNYVEVPSVRMPKRCNGRICFPTNTVDEKMGRLFGYIAAEGSIQDTMLTITSHVDEKLVDEVSSLIRDLFGIEPSWERIKGNARTAGWGNNNLMLILQALGFPLNEHCRQKVIPWSILQSPKSVVAQFISAYFCGDGCVSASHHKDRSVSVSSASGELIKQIQILLGNFGIHSSQYSGWRATGWAGSAKTEYWKLSIRGKSLERFRNEIGFLPDFHEKVMRLDYLADLPHAADPSEFHAVKSLVADGREPTYDLSMQSDHHNFLANGVVCHNTNANFAVAVGHLEDAPPDEKGDVWPHVIIDYLKVWKPGDYPDHTVDYVQIQEELDSLLTRFPSTTKISFDQWNSASFLANIRRDFSPNIRVVEEVFTDRTNQTRCERFKSALNLGWVHSYLDHFGEDGTSLLETECKFLTEKNGKVIKQDFGPCTTKDLFDAVCVVTTDLLHHALDRWVAAVATAGSYGSSDISGLKSGREFERIGAMNGDYRGNIARELLQRQSIDRTRDRMRMTREPGFPTRGRVTDPTRKRFR